jgi:ubiquinone/menaquinone biosynthesis C-methylase UbiE
MQSNAVKAEKGMGMEGAVARWYAKNTLRDMEELRKLAAKIAEELPNGGDILEVAPGPGYLAIELARQSRYRVNGIDISETFVEMATNSARAAKVQVEFRQGNAAAMPYHENSFDLVVCRAAFKNFFEPVKAINEMYRVLRPGGRALIIDLRRGVSPRAINSHVDQMGVGFISTMMMKLTFRFMLIKRAYTKEQFTQFIALSSFGRFAMHEDDIGFELWLYK